MNGQELSNWRESVTAVLTEVKTDVKWIKENLGRMDEKQVDLTRQVSWLRGVGSVVGVILAAVLTFVTRVVLGGR